MITCTPITTAGVSHGGVQTIAIPLTAPRFGDARFFAVITGDRSERSTSDARTVANIATAIENIATASASVIDGSRDTYEWLSVLVKRLQQQLDPALIHGVHACLGIAAEADGRLAITIACAGALGALVIRRGTGDVVRAIPIAEPQSATDGLRFPHAVDGTIGAQDTVVIGSAALFDPRTTDAVVRAFREHPVRNTITALRSLAPEQRFHGMVIASASARELPRSQSSMRTFLATAASTERFLTPTLGPVLRAYGANLRSTVASLTRRRRPSRSRSVAHPRILTFLLEVIRVTLRTIAVGARSAAAILIDGLRLIGIAGVHAVRAARSLRARPLPTSRSLYESLHPRSIIAHGRIALLRSRSWHRSLPPLSRRLFLLTMIFGALFLVSTGALWRRRAVDLDVAAYNVTIAAIEELRSVAEARLLFNDRTGARAALAEATARLGTLPGTSRARRERAALLGDELRTSFDRARMITRLPQPLLVARGGETIPFADLGGVALLERGIAVVSSDGRRLALVNPRTGTNTLRELQGTHPVTAPFRTIALDDRSLLILDAHARAAIIDSRDGTVHIATIEQPPADIRDAAIYQNRLYLLRGDGSITRHTRTAAGFARGSLWLEAARALAGARTMSVAGSIAVSGDDGSLATYTAGRRKDTDLLAEVDPPLHSASRMVASADGRTLYVGDPGEGRVVAITATGDLIGQIQSDAFRGLSGLAFDPDGPSLYVWHGDAVSVVVPPKPAK